MKKILFTKTGWAAALCALFSFAATSPAAAQTRELGAGGELLDGIAAIVEDGVVLKSELAERLAEIMPALRQQQGTLPPMSVIEEQVLEMLIVEEIQMQRADRVGLQVSDQDLNQYLTALAQENGLTIDQLPAALAAQGVDYPTFREDRRNEIVRETLMRREVEARISISPRELAQCVNRLESAQATENDYHVSHILIGISANESTQDARERAEAVYTQLQQGAEFAQVAIAQSDAPTALQGGDLGWRPGSQLPSQFADTVIRMQPGEISEPIQTATGFHIVRLNEMRGGERVMQDQLRVRHILLRPNELLDNDAIRQRLTQLREGILGGDEFGPIARAVSEDAVSASDGGDVGWIGPGDTVPEFEQVIDSLDLDEISEPFQSRYGWHIVQVTDRREHDLTDELKQERCIQQIRAQKGEEEMQLWLQRLRDQAFVSILL